MLTISKSKLKANMLEIFRQIEESGEELIVTHHAEPVLRISPIRKKYSVEEMFEGLRESAEFYGDPDEPTTDEWNEV